MRIPLSKIYRAFPELDSFTDEQCKRFMKRIEVSGARRILPLLAFFLVTGVGLCASCVLFSLIYNIIDQAFPQFRAGRYQLLTNGIILVLTLGLVEADLIPPRTAGHHQGTEVK